MQLDLLERELFEDLEKAEHLLLKLQTYDSEFIYYFNGLIKDALFNLNQARQNAEKVIAISHLRKSLPERYNYDR